MNKTLLLLLLILVAAGLGAFLLWSSDGLPSIRPTGPEVQTESSADETAADFAASVVVDAGEKGTLPEDFLRAEATSDIRPSGRPLVVQIWQGKKGNPAPAAEVFILEGSASAKAESEDPFASHISALAETRGRRFDADANGRVELPPVQEWAIVTARLPGSYGFAFVGRDHREVETVLLQVDETVTVRVVDGAGKTVAGVPVGIVQTVPLRQGREEVFARLKELEKGMAQVRDWMTANPDQRERAGPKMQAMREEFGKLRREAGEDGADSKGGDRAVAQRARRQQEPETRAELRARRRTDETGLAVFRHFQIYRNPGEKWWQPEQGDDFQAVLLMPLARPEQRTFRGRQLAEEILELRLPQTGSIALRTVDRDGRPFTHPVHAEVRVEGEDGGVARWSRLQVRKAQNEDAIIFPFVGLGLRLFAQCRLDDEDFRWRAPVFAGPMQPGERVVVDLVVAPGEGMLCGRLLDATGKPLADEEITFLINGLAGRLEGEEVLLDRDGRFHLPYQMRPQHQPPFDLQIRRPGAVPVAGLAMAIVSLPREHVTDLGDLALTGFGVVAEGVVVDDRGQPIPGAHLQLQRERNVGREQVRMEFVEEAFARAIADADGCFALFSQLENARYRLHVQAKEHFEVWTPGLRRDAGTVPQTIELSRRSRLIGTVLRPEWLQAKGVRAELSLSNDPQKPRGDQVRDHKDRTYVYFDWVRPGVYDLKLRVQQFPDPFLRVDRLVIEPGQMGLHPRLKDIDLASFLYRFEIFAVDEQGQPLQPNRPLLARIQRPNGSSAYVGFPWQKNRVEMFSTSPQTDVLAMTEGYTTDPTVVAPGRNEISFRRIPPVEVHLAGMSALAGTTNVQVVLELLDTRNVPQELEIFDDDSKRIAMWHARAKYTAAMLGDDDIARVALTRMGPHKVILRFGVEQGIRPTLIELSPVDIQPQSGSTSQRITVNYDQQVVQAAITEAAQKIAANR